MGIRFWYYCYWIIGVGDFLFVMLVRGIGGVVFVIVLVIIVI